MESYRREEEIRRYITFLADWYGYNGRERQEKLAEWRFELPDIDWEAEKEKARSASLRRQLGKLYEQYLKLLDSA